MTVIYKNDWTVYEAQNKFHVREPLITAHGLLFVPLACPVQRAASMSLLIFVQYCVNWGEVGGCLHMCPVLI